jgi:predicted alpha/beta superfamily hydrolase
MKCKGRVSLFLAIILFVSTSSLAADNGKDIVIGKSVSIRSKILDEERTIYIHTPGGYEDGDEEYPVLYILDGMPYFQMSVGVMKYHTMFHVLPKMIVVGIPNTDRNRDLTPTNSNIYQGEKVDWLKNTGGADNMLRFVKDELFPYIETNYRTQAFRIIAGHSFGALFAAHGLLSQPELFNAYICISTSLWFDDNILTRKLESIKPPVSFPNRFLYLSVGGKEDSKQLNANHEFVNCLREQQPEGLTWTFDYLDEEDHGSQGLKAMINGLEFVYATWKQPSYEYEKGLVSVSNHFDRLSKLYGYVIPVPKDHVINYGYTMLNKKEYRSAIEFFDYYASRFPNDPNAFDCLGESYERMEQLQTALDNYEKACEIAKANNDPRLETFEANRARVEEKFEKRD